MTTESRIERALPRILDDLGAGPPPDYTDDLLAGAASMRQRPGWAFPEWWLPRPTATGGVAVTPRLPWRTLAVIALVILALVAGALFVGSRQPPLPPPTGPAENGLIAYSWRGDIYVGDPATGSTTAIVTGPGKLVNPLFSPDGTHIAFVRGGDHSRGIGPEIAVVQADGSGERVVVPHDSTNLTNRLGHFAWTPDSASLVVAHGFVERPSSAPTPPYDQALSIVVVSGVTEPRLLTPPLPRWPGRQWMVPTAAMAQMFRPPRGDRVLAGTYDELSVFDADLERATQLGGIALEDFEPYWVRWPAWSPDGSMILFSLDRGEFGWFDSVVGSFVVNADGTGVRRIGPSGLVTKSAWSPDSTRIAFERWTIEPDRPEAVIFIVEVASGAERVLEATTFPTSGRGPIPQGWSWSPDGRSVVFVEREGAHPIVVDVDTGQTTELPWEVESAPSWQRVPLD